MKIRWSILSMPFASGFAGVAELEGFDGVADPPPLADALGEELDPPPPLVQAAASARPAAMTETTRCERRRALRSAPPQPLGVGDAEPASGDGVPADPPFDELSRGDGGPGEGYGFKINGGRGFWVKSNSLVRSPSCGAFSRTLGRESGRPSVFGSRRFPVRNRSSISFR